MSKAVEDDFEDVVYIIESPSSMDILNGQFEGKALSEALGLAQIAHRYFLVTDEEALSACFAMIAEHSNEKRRDLIYLHISAHGSEDDDGFFLTNQTLISWHRLRDELLELAGKTDHFDADLRVAFIVLTLSICFGLTARCMVDNRHECPFVALVASDQAVFWTDALTGFIALYHNCVHKKRIDSAINAMNYATGEDNLFKMINSSDVGFPL